MTYWPISSPSVFAATKHTNPERTVVSHDGIRGQQSHERPEDPDDSSKRRTEPELVSEGTNGTGYADGATTENTSVLDTAAEDDIHGEIIAIRVTRSGHMFATLTRSTLTIWQTKACLPPIPDMCIANT
jgi:RAB6A-GEF complex partner protein 1